MFTQCYPFPSMPQYVMLRSLSRGEISYCCCQLLPVFDKPRLISLSLSLSHPSSAVIFQNHFNGHGYRCVGTHMCMHPVSSQSSTSISSILVRSFSVKTFPTIYTDNDLVFSSLPFTFCFFSRFSSSSSIFYGKTKMSDFICCCSVVLVVCCVLCIQLACCCCHIVIAITFLGCFTSRFLYLFAFCVFQLLCFSQNCSAFILLASSGMNFFSLSLSMYIFLSGIMLS